MRKLLHDALSSDDLNTIYVDNWGTSKEMIHPQRISTGTILLTLTEKKLLEKRNSGNREEILWK